VKDYHFRLGIKDRSQRALHSPRPLREIIFRKFQFSR